MSGRNPDFLVIGAMKAGSTTLHTYLSRHPDLYLHERKEPGFFSREERYARGIEWYRALFADARPDQLCAESSTCYTRWPHFADVAPRIRQHVPEVRFVYIMRDPVARAYSHYAHMMGERRSEGLPVLSFGEALE